MRLQVLWRKENSVLPLRQSKSLINKHLDYYCPTVTVRPLLRFLTISRVIELCFKQDWSLWKAKTWGYKFSEGRRTHSASKTIKITHQQTFELLLFNCYCLVFEPLLSDRFLTISRVIELRFKQDWSLWKAKTWGYKFSEERRI